MVDVQTGSGSTVQDGQENVAVFLCQKFGIPLTDLPSDDIRTHPEFMHALACVSSTAKSYFTLLSTWTSMKCFTKKNSLLSQRLHYANTKVLELKCGLIELSQSKVITRNLAVHLKSCQAKMNKMLSLLPLLFDSKQDMEDVVTNLQSSVRAQKARRFNKQTGTKEYNLLSGNSLSLTWEHAIENITDMDAEDFSPLTVSQIRAFPGIKDMCHRQGMEAIPQFIIQDQFQLTEDKLKDGIYLLVDLFPLLLIEKGHQRVVLDYVELVFRP